MAQANPQDQIKYIFLDGNIVPWDQGNIHVSTHALLYGTGCFEGIRGYLDGHQNQVCLFRGEEHYQRLLESCRLLLIDLEYDTNRLIELTKLIIQKNEFRCDLYIRPVAYKKFGPQFIGANLFNVSNGFFILVIPKDVPQTIQQVRIGTSSWRKAVDTGVPPRGKFTGSYINSNLAKAEALRNGFDDALLLTEEGFVAEATTSNLFMLRRNVIVTPPVYSDILEGITRDTVIRIGKELNLAVEERPIHRSELYLADEAFICGTAEEIKSVVELDHRAIAGGMIGPTTKAIWNFYRKMVRGEAEQFRNFLLPIY